MRIPMFTALTALCVLLSGPAAAYDLRPFQGQGSKAGLADLAPFIDRQENRNNQFFSEQYSFSTRLDDGHGLWFQVLITNMGTANGRAALQVHLRRKGEKKRKTRALFARQKWSHESAGDKVTLTLGDNRLEGALDGWKGHFDTDEFTLDWRIENPVPAWRPGGGTVYYGSGKKSYYDITLIAPRGRIEADVTYKKTGEKLHLKGTVYGDHSASNLAPNLLANRWIKLRRISSHQTIVLTLLKTPEQYGNRWAGFFVVASDRRIVASGSNPQPEVKAVEKDSANNYQVPTLLPFTGADGIPGFAGAIKTVKRTGRRDSLAGLSAIERAVVSKIVKPVTYTYSAQFEFKADAGGKERTWRGKTKYNYEQLNP